MCSRLFRATPRALTQAADGSRHVENPELDNLARPRVEAIENAPAGECTSASLVLAGRDELAGGRSDLSTPSAPPLSFRTPPISVSTTLSVPVTESLGQRGQEAQNAGSRAGYSADSAARLRALCAVTFEWSVDELDQGWCGIDSVVGWELLTVSGKIRCDGGFAIR